MRGFFSGRSAGRTLFILGTVLAVGAGPPRTVVQQKPTARVERSKVDAYFFTSKKGYVRPPTVDQLAIPKRYLPAAKRNVAAPPHVPTDLAAARLKSEEKQLIVKSIHAQLANSGFKVKPADNVVHVIDMTNVSKVANTLLARPEIQVSFQCPLDVQLDQNQKLFRPVRLPPTSTATPSSVDVLYNTKGPGWYVLLFSIAVPESIGGDKFTLKAVVDGVAEDKPIVGSQILPVLGARPTQVAITVQVPDASWHTLQLTCSEHYWVFWNVEVLQTVGG
jgi:hypothetical protein